MYSGIVELEQVWVQPLVLVKGKSNATAYKDILVTCINGVIVRFPIILDIWFTLGLGLNPKLKQFNSVFLFFS